MKKKISIVNIITFIITFISVMLIFCNLNIVRADLYEDIYGQGASLAGVAGIIIGIIRWVGTAILIGAVIMKGIQFVSSSPDGQAKIKNEIILLVLGGILLFSFTWILEIIENAVIESGMHKG